ncbi:MAG: peptidase domain-containing ABC transporter [Bacteroidota bacterium]
MLFDRFPFYNQHDSSDCGPACLKMILEYYGKKYDLSELREHCKLTKLGVSLADLERVSQELGFKVASVKVPLEDLKAKAILPAVLFWDTNHFVVLYKIKKGKFYIADPAYGKVKVEEAQLAEKWVKNDKDGIVMMLYPDQAFPEVPETQNPRSPHKWISFLYNYAKHYKSLFIQLLIGVFFTGLLMTVTPFLNQLLVDNAIASKNINLVWLIILAQIFLFIGNTSIDILSNWVSLFASTRISVKVTSDFLMKIMKGAFSFFETKTLGDINQRIADNNRLEMFLTAKMLDFLFFTIIIVSLSAVMAYFSPTIFLLFVVLSSISILWVLALMKKRRTLDFVRFQYLSENQDFLVETIRGMQDIKTNDATQYKRRGWENIQFKLFGLSYDAMKLENMQRVGFDSINQFKNIAILLLAAIATIQGTLSIGTLLSLSFILGQLNVPLYQLPEFIKAVQDTRISADRIMEVTDNETEEQLWQSDPEKTIYLNGQIGDLGVKNLSFSYGTNKNMVLKNVNFNIPVHKTTAIVGTSGSGKTTLLKLLLGLYTPTDGDITMGGASIRNFAVENWRRKCGVVFQDGYIFSDSLKNNILMGKDYEESWFEECLRVANLGDLVGNLPMDIETQIGSNGMGLSQGQKQRILIARALYKDPDYLFLDEATSSLDANTERAIVTELDHYFKNKTVFVIAHRLSTVKNADQIIVLENGEIIESGSHNELIDRKSNYYHLIRNQLELG